MDDIDIGLFDRDWNNTLYYFILNADEQIYMRYGGREARAPDTYLNLNSLEVALESGLELHRQHQQGKLEKVERPKPLFAREMPLLVERTFARNACVECHLIGDYQNIQRELDGKLDKLTHLYRSPDIKTLGIDLDVPKGLVVKEVRGAVEAAGMKPGDRIAKLNGTPVWTFGDLQYRYDKVPRNADRIRMTVERDEGPIDLSIALPERWWWTDLTFRQWTVEPRVYFESLPLTESEKREHGLVERGFASKVKRVDSFAEIMKSHELRVGDIVFGVDGVERDEIANTAELFIKLRKTAGETVTLDLIRDGRRMQMPLTTFRMSFRK
jgi:serine protease Do